MIQSYSTETIAWQLQALQLPYSDLIANVLTALLTARKATLHQVACLLPGQQTLEAKRQQIRRLLDQPALTTERWATIIARLLPCKTPWVLSLDRTNWMVGKQPVNLLVLAVVCSGCAVPLLWLPLEKEGASHTEERKALLKRFLVLFGQKSIRFLTADREFIGQDWIKWLQEQRIPFRIRIKAGEYLKRTGGEERHACQWFACRSSACKPYRMKLWGVSVFVGGKRLSRNHEEFLIVISNEPGDLLEEYRCRWKIETLFQAFKGRGFDLELSHLTQGTRLSVWFGCLSLALCWCLKVGEFLDSSLPLKLKKHGRRSESVFHRGLYALQAVLACLSGSPSLTRFLDYVNLMKPRTGT